MRPRARTALGASPDGSTVRRPGLRGYSRHVWAPMAARRIAGGPQAGGRPGETSRGPPPATPAEPRPGAGVLAGVGPVGRGRSTAAAGQCLGALGRRRDRAAAHRRGADRRPLAGQHRGLGDHSRHRPHTLRLASCAARRAGRPSGTHARARAAVGGGAAAGLPAVAPQRDGRAPQAHGRYQDPGGAGQPRAPAAHASREADRGGRRSRVRGRHRPYRRPGGPVRQQ